MDTKTIQSAQLLWHYMSSFSSLEKSDAIVVCCSYDLRVCDYACELIKSGVSEKLIFSGNTGNWTKHIWASPEADIFRERAISNGVEDGVIITERKATNFGENVSFSKTLLPHAKSVTFLSKPNSLLRLKLTVAAQWPDLKYFTSSPTISFPNEVSNVVGVLGVVNEMVGDIDRIIQYADRGFQVPHVMPENILQAWHYLKGEGFTEHLI